MPDMYEAVFRWPHQSPSTVILTGTFDQWSRSLSLTKGPSGFEGRVRIPWGSKVAYKFIVDGQWTTVEGEPAEPDSAGNWNNVYTAPPQPQPEPEPEPPHESVALASPAPAPASLLLAEPQPASEPAPADAHESQTSPDSQAATATDPVLAPVETETEPASPILAPPIIILPPTPSQQSPPPLPSISVSDDTPKPSATEQSTTSPKDSESIPSIPAVGNPPPTSSFRFSTSSFRAKRQSFLLKLKHIFTHDHDNHGEKHKRRGSVPK